MEGHANVLVLTPMRDAVSHLDLYFANLDKLTYPPEHLALGIVEGDSRDDTRAQLERRLPALRARYRRVGLWRKDTGFHMPENVPRWAPGFQFPRRAALARVRNHLLMNALQADDDWVLWMDSDLAEYPPDVIERLIAQDRPVVQPHCVLEYGGETFDLNAWREHGRVHMDRLRGGPDLVRLDSVGGSMLLVEAELHREGLIFPPFPYGAQHPACREFNAMFPPGVKGELETEGLGLMAQDMGRQCWGMPNLEILHLDH